MLLGLLFLIVFYFSFCEAIKKKAGDSSLIHKEIWENWSN